MIKILTVVGARPQIIKAAALSRTIQEKFSGAISETLVHTGQHYDQDMSQVFFDELGIPAPTHNLQVGSQSHGKQTAQMITGLEAILLQEKPDYLIVYGDTNSTLAGAVAASKIHIPVVHIEAGLRSFNKSMPEETNRIMCDHASTLLFTPTAAGLANLRREGFPAGNEPPFTPDHQGVFHCGDIMLDNSLYFAPLARECSTILKREALDPGKYLLVTIHRDNNTDNASRLTSIFKAILRITRENDCQAAVPLHPRTAHILQKTLPAELYRNINKSGQIKLLAPASYFDMIMLESNAQIILTDSGGVQKEAYFFGIPSIIVRSETEWIEIVEQNAGILTDADEDRMAAAYQTFRSRSGIDFPPIFGNGHAAEFICDKLISNHSR
jgi:UDP-GlcNAc3NAcA epimerase